VERHEIKHVVREFFDYDKRSGSLRWRKRARHIGIEDMRKAAWYLNYYLQKRGGS
jgi:hypothetical protein